MSSDKNTPEDQQKHSQRLIWVKDADLQHKLHELHGHKNKGMQPLPLLLLSLQTLGVVYGDIGTSPLYVFASIFPDGAPEDDKKILGAFSMIFWTLTSVILIKYVLLMLRADDRGEGGIISLYTIIKRAADIPTPTDLHDSLDGQFDEFTTSFSIKAMSASARALIRNLHTKLWQQTCLLLVVLLGVNMIISDGVLTPAISVVSAVEGMEYHTTMEKPDVLGVSIAIIVVLFFIQQFGTEKVSFLFSPIIVLWLFTLLGMGIYNLVMYEPSVAKGLSPVYIYYFWSGNSNAAWRQLGAIMLSITGGEALYADLGHFNAKSIQLSFIAFVYPSLVVTYLGQTSYIMKNRQTASTAFWSSTPQSIAVPVIIIATLAAIIASQALITGAFSIMKQAISIKCFPRFTIKQTSNTNQGQIYIPEVNWSLMIGCIIIVAAFQSSTRIGNAYGLAIATVMVIDTILLSIVMLIDWNWNVFIAALFLLVYSFISCAYLSSNLLKVPDGAWFSIVLSGILSVVCYVYWWGQTCKVRYIRGHMVKLGDVLELDDGEEAGMKRVVKYGGYADSPGTNGESRGDGLHRRCASRSDHPGSKPVSLENRDHHAPGSIDTLTHLSTASMTPKLYPGIKPIRLVGTKLPVARLPGLGFYYSELIDGLPPLFLKYLTLNPAIHECVIVVTIRSVPLPALPDDERLLIRKLNLEGFYHVIARYGYTERVCQGEEFARIVVDEVLEYLECQTTELLHEEICSVHASTGDGVGVGDAGGRDIEEGNQFTVTSITSAATSQGDSANNDDSTASSMRARFRQLKSLMRVKSLPGQIGGIEAAPDGAGTPAGEGARGLLPELMVSVGRDRASRDGLVRDMKRWESSGDAEDLARYKKAGRSVVSSQTETIKRSKTIATGTRSTASALSDAAATGASGSQFPWMRQPSKINRLLSSPRKTLDGGRDTYMRRVWKENGYSRGASRLGGEYSYDETSSVPLPPPPPRPRIHRRAGSDTIQEHAEHQVHDKGPGTVKGGGVEDMVGESPGSTLVGRSAESLQRRLQEERDKAFKNNDTLAAEKGLILTAYSHGLVHLIGRADLKASGKEKKVTGVFRRFVINSMYAFLSSNSRPAAADYNIPMETMLETRSRYEV